MDVGCAQFLIVVPLLLAEDVLSKSIILNGKVSIEQLRQGIVNGCTTCRNLRIVGVEVGVDEVDVPIHGCGIGREGIEVLAEGLGGSH